MVFVPGDLRPRNLIQTYMDPHGLGRFDDEPQLCSGRTQKRAMHASADPDSSLPIQALQVPDLKGIFRLDGIDKEAFLQLVEKFNLQIKKEAPGVDKIFILTHGALLTKSFRYRAYLELREEVEYFPAAAFLALFDKDQTEKAVAMTEFEKVLALELFLQRNGFDDQGVDPALFVDFVNALIKVEKRTD